MMDDFAPNEAQLQSAYPPVPVGQLRKMKDLRLDALKIAEVEHITDELTNSLATIQREWLDARDRAIKEIITGYAVILGLTPEELLEQYVLEEVWEPDKSMFRESVENLMGLSNQYRLVSAIKYRLVSRKVV